VGDPSVSPAPSPGRRFVHVLTEFPEESLEALVVRWEFDRPTVLIQLKEDPREPVQFPGLRPAIPGNADLPRDLPSALDRPLLDFIDPTSGRVFGALASRADFLISHRAFDLLQPEPDLVLPAEFLWECRAEAIRAVGGEDEPGLPSASPER
jgi:hypothetical protein